MNDTAPINTHSELHRILFRSLERLAVIDGLTVLEIAARCGLMGRTPTFPAFSSDVVSAFAKLEREQTRGPVLEVMA
jgi:hypothetical protein